MGTRDCCTFSYFRTAKASGNTRLLNFFIIHEQQNEWKHRDCCNFSYFFCNFTEKQTRNATTLCTFFRPLSTKTLVFSKKCTILAGNCRRPATTGDNRRNRRPLGGTLRAPETSIFATPLAESTEKYLWNYKYARLSSLCLLYTSPSPRD